MTGDGAPGWYNFAFVKSMFSEVHCHFGGSLHVPLWRSGGCWLADFLEGHTTKWKALATSAGGKNLALSGEELLGRFLGLGSSSSCSRTAPCGSPRGHKPLRLAKPLPRHFLSSPEGFGWHVSLLGSISSCLFPCSVISLSSEVDLPQLVIPELSWSSAELDLRLKK